jgi:hypothetical protein
MKKVMMDVTRATVCMLCMCVVCAHCDRGTVMVTWAWPCACCALMRLWGPQNSCFNKQSVTVTVTVTTETHKRMPCCPAWISLGWRSRSWPQSRVTDDLLKWSRSSLGFRIYRMLLGLWTGWLNSLDTKVNTFVFNKLPVTVTVTVRKAPPPPSVEWALQVQLQVRTWFPKVAGLTVIMYLLLKIPSRARAFRGPTQWGQWLARKRSRPGTATATATVTDSLFQSSRHWEQSCLGKPPGSQDPFREISLALRRIHGYSAWWCSRMQSSWATRIFQYHHPGE